MENYVTIKSQATLRKEGITLNRTESAQYATLCSRLFLNKNHLLKVEEDKDHFYYYSGNSIRVLPFSLVESTKEYSPCFTIYRIKQLSYARSIPTVSEYTEGVCCRVIKSRMTPAKAAMENFQTAYLKQLQDLFKWKRKRVKKRSYQYD